jgi:hypothetical protein
MKHVVTSGQKAEFFPLSGRTVAALFNGEISEIGPNGTHIGSISRVTRFLGE